MNKVTDIRTCKQEGKTAMRKTHTQVVEHPKMNSNASHKLYQEKKN